MVSLEGDDKGWATFKKNYHIKQNTVPYRDCLYEKFECQVSVDDIFSTHFNLFPKLLAEMVIQEDLDQGRVYPPLSKIREVSTKLALGLTKYAYKNKLALKYPEPEDKDRTIRAHQYTTGYESFVPEMYDWPPQKSSQL